MVSGCLLSCASFPLLQLPLHSVLLLLQLLVGGEVVTALLLPLVITAALLLPMQQGLPKHPSLKVSSKLSLYSARTVWLVGHAVLCAVAVAAHCPLLLNIQHEHQPDRLKIASVT